MPEPLPIEDVIVRPNRRRGPKWWMVPTIIATTASLIVMLVALFVVQAENDRTIERSSENAARIVKREVINSQIEGCERAQVQRGVLRLVGAQGADKLSRLLDSYLPIIDCRTTYRRNGGFSVPLPPSLDGCFLRLVGERYFLDNTVSTSPEKLKGLCDG
jgi:hypothetical protein